MADDEAQVKLSADIEELKSGMEDANAAVKNALDGMGDALKGASDQAQQASRQIGDAMEGMAESFRQTHEAIASSFEKITGGIEKVGAVFVGLGAILAGGAIFKEVIEAGINWDTEVGKLSHTLGITMESASNLNAALRIIGVSSDEYTSAVMRLERQLKQHEGVLQSVGMVTREANGDLVDGQTAMQNAIAAMSQYKAGSDQMIVSQTMFGRGAGDMTRLLHLNNEALEQGAQAAKDLGLRIGTDAYEATVGYEQEVNKFKLQLTALAIQIGKPVMEALKVFADWLTSEGPSAVNAMLAAIKGLAEGFNYVVAMGQKFAAVFSTIKDPTAANMNKLHDTITQINSDLDTSNAKLELFFARSAGGGTSGTSPQGGLDKVALGSGTKTLSQEDIEALRGGGGSAGAESAPAQDLVAQWEEALQRIKDSQSDLNAWSTAQDYAFWNEKLAQATVGSNEWWQIWHKMADEFRQMTEEQQKAAEQQQKNAEIIAKGTAEITKNDADTAIKIEEEKINSLYNLGQISATQRYQQLKELYDQQYQAELKAMYDEITLLQQRGDSTLAAQVKAWEQIEKAQNQHNLKMQKDEDQTLLTMQKQWDNYATQVGNALTGLLFKHQTFLQAVQSYEEKAFSYIINTLLTKLVHAWVQHEAEELAATQAGTTARSATENSGYFSQIIAKITVQAAQWLGFETSKTAATQAGTTARTAIDNAGALAGRAAQTAANIAEVTADAAVAYAGAYAATASIPYVGPAMAPGVATGAMAAVLAMIPMASLDTGAWTIPREMTARLHPGEMVVPKPFATGMREGGGGFSAGGDVHHWHVQAIDSKSFVDMLTDSKSDLYKLLKQGFRNKHF